MLTNISALKQAERNLQESQNFNHSVIDSLSEHIAILNQQGIIVSVNSKWCDFYSANSNAAKFTDFVGVNYLSICRQAINQPSGDEAAAVLSGIESILSGKQDEFILEYPCHSAKIERWFRLKAVALKGQCSGVIVSHENIADVNIAELKLAKMCELLDKVCQIAEVGGFERDAVTLQATWSPQVFKIHEIDDGVVPTYEQALNFYDAENSAIIKNAIADLFAHGTPYDLELPMTTAKGNVIWVRTQAQPEFVNGKIVKLIGVFQNITKLKKNQIALQKSRKGLLQIIDMIPDMLWIKDADGRFLMVNEVSANNYHMNPKELIGRLHADVHPDPAEVTQMLADDRQVLASGKVLFIPEESFMTPDGVTHILETTKIPLEFYKTNAPAILSIATDITERRQIKSNLKKLANRLQLAIRAGGVGIWDWDITTNSLVWDEQMYKLYGISEHDFDGAYESWLQGVHPDDVTYCEEQIQLALDGKKEYAIEFRVKWPDRSIHTICGLGLVERDKQGQAVRMVCTNWDITERKNFEVELMELNQNLERRVVERTVELTEAITAANNANASKSNFLANMSHELRTPLNGMIGLTDQALRLATDPHQVAQLTKSKQAAQHLLEIINDILDISKIEAGRIKLSKHNFSLNQIIDDCFVMMEAAAHSKDLQLTATIDKNVPVILHGDDLRIKQILLNYMGNAIKFSERGHITLHVQAVEPITETFDDSVLLRIAVTDQGIGLSPTQQEHLFKPFSQADASITRKYGGTGLGLIISKRLANLMEGDVGVISEPGKGSTFWVTMRLNLGDGAESRALNSPAQQPLPIKDELVKFFTGKRILLAEDEPFNQEVAQFILEDVGFKVDIVSNGQQALAKASAQPYALILMDVQMPVMNGLDATRAIKKLSGYAEVPILAMTANAFDEDRDICFDAGMDDHISKPVLPNILYGILWRWLKNPPSVK